MSSRHAPGRASEAAPPRAGAGMNLTSIIKRLAQTRPGHPATIDHGRVRSWGEFTQRVARMAGAFQALGLQRGDRVAMLAQNSDRYLELYFSPPWAGGSFVPINTRLSLEEKAYVLRDCGARILLVDDAFAEQGLALAACCPEIVHLIDAGNDAPAGGKPGMLDYEALIAAHAPVADADLFYEDMAAIFYTGGTTGDPKGVMLSHRAIWTSSMSSVADYGMTSDAIYLHAAPMFHIGDGSLGMQTTIAGGTHAFLPAYDPVRLLTMVQEHRVTHTMLIATMIRMLIDHPEFDRFDLSSLRRLVYGAAPISEQLLTEATRRLPNCAFLQGYGQTELSPCITYLAPEYHVTSGPLAGKLRSVGQANPVSELLITDDDGTELPRGEVGEIRVRGPHAMSGYWNKPAETAATLVNGWVRTGDAAYMDNDGFVFIVDRLKDMIISGGENIFCGEVENAVATHPAVATCAVIGVPHETWGEAVHAIVILRQGASATARDIIAHCRAHIAGFKCPQSIDFRTEPLPLSGAGKILKRELRKPFWAGKDRAVN